MNTSKLVAGAGIVLALILGTIGAFSPATIVERTEVVKEQPLGSNPGPDFFLPYMNLNGSFLYPYGQKFVKQTGASTTVCSFMSPKGASSTIEYAAMHIQARTNSGTAGIIGTISAHPDIGVNTRDATGTVIAQSGTDSPNSGEYLVATTTLTTLPGGIVASSTPVSFYVTTSSSASGTCAVWFRQP